MYKRQEYLRALHREYNVPLIAADGIFGPKTRAAVSAFQKISGIAVDGIIGPDTWERIVAARLLLLSLIHIFLRLHSTDCPFNGKEPWNFNLIAETAMKDFLRLRHKLIPYLYTMNARAAYEDLPLVEPMYYAYPWEEAAYCVTNQYFFGSELMVCPITQPAAHDKMCIRDSAMSDCNPPVWQKCFCQIFK